MARTWFSANCNRYLFLLQMEVCYRMKIAGARPGFINDVCLWAFVVLPPARAKHKALVLLVEVRTGHGVWQPGEPMLISAEEGSTPLLASGAFTSATEVLDRCLCV